MICPGTVALFIWFPPESPRWLVGESSVQNKPSAYTLTNTPVGQERFEEARSIVVKYHANGDATHPIVNLQMSEMSESMRNGGMMTWKSTFDIRNLFNTRARRYCLALCIAFSWFGQFSGNNIASYVLNPPLFSRTFTYVNNSTFPFSSKTSALQTQTPNSSSTPSMPSQAGFSPVQALASTISSVAARCLWARPSVWRSASRS
jgi:hypothetical protein